MAGTEGMRGAMAGVGGDGGLWNSRSRTGKCVLRVDSCILQELAYARLINVFLFFKKGLGGARKHLFFFF